MSQTDKDYDAELIGLQTALVAQQMSARSQLEQMRRGALPPGKGEPETTSGTGQYL